MHAIAFFEKMDRYHAAESLQGYNCSELGQGPPPPLIWTKSKRTAAIFRDVFPYTGTNREMKFVKCFTPVRFLKLSNLPEKTRKLRHLMKKIENVRCFIYLFFNKLSVFVQIFTQLQNHSSHFVKNHAWIWQILKKQLYFLKILPEPKIIYISAFVPFMTNTMFAQTITQFSCGLLEKVGLWLGLW